MRIARIIEYFPPHIGGMERHGLILSQEQIKLGHEVDIFIGVGGLEPNQKPKSDFGIYKMPLQFLPLYSKFRRFWFNIWAYFAVKKIHKKTPFNVIHLHGDFVEAYFGGALSKKLGIPAILTIHAGLNKRLLKPKNAKYFSNIAKIICVSGEIKQDLESIGITSDKLEVISSGIYLNDFQNVNLEEIAKIKNEYSSPIIISVGVLRLSKGQKYLIEAFGKLKKQFNSATLLLISDGPDRKNLENQAKNIGNIYFLGRQEHDKIIKYLCASDIFVLPSIDAPNDREGTPTVIMEAMAAGLPVVATKVGGNPYLIKDGENGLLVEEKDAQALTQAMIKLIGDENLRQKMRDKNLEDIKQKDWLIISQKITNVYFFK
ncbi:MAG: glycosyltransferase family 4 protein [Candidatus Azambacteria bacterium]|nr:glycosyltransferase family 4 protein [Candidatus Azambacteria bacterium]